MVSNDVSFFVTSKSAKMGVDFARNVLNEKQMNFLKCLPKKRIFKRDGLSFYITHGSPHDNLHEYVQPYVSDEKLKEYKRMVDSDVVVLGHTHVMMEAKVDDVLFLNPGSVGQPRDGVSKSSFMVFDTDEKKADWYRVDYNIKGAAEAVYENNLSERSARRLFDGR